MLRTGKITENLGFLSLGNPDSNVYVLNDDTLIDTTTGMHPEILAKGLKSLGTSTQNIKRIINTHYHLEHTGGNSFFRNAQIFMHRKASELANDPVRSHKIMYPSNTHTKAHVLLEHNHALNLNGSIWKILQSPNNEDGHLCLFNEKDGFLFSGDTEKELIDTLDLNIKYVLPAHGEPYEYKG